MSNKKTLLSTLWVFVTLNYLYCDLMGLMDPELLKQYFTGQVEGLKINEQFLFYIVFYAGVYWRLAEDIM